jgi:hypothetical protein
LPCDRGNIAPFPALFFKQQAEETDILPGHRTRVLVVLLVGIAIVAGCGRRRTTRSGPARQLKKSELTVAEQKYGIAPIPGPSVTYQPDVIVVGGGGDAIRAQSANGFIWTIDAKAPRAADLVPGKIFFMTNRAVGRVLDVRKDGGNLVVVLGPVNLTDVVQEAHLDIHTPIDFDEALAYSSPDLPGQVVSVARASTGDEATVRPAVFVTESGSAGGSDPVSLKDFTVVPIVNRFGIGVEGSQTSGGLTAYAQATLHMAAPTLDAHIDITPTGGVEQASLTLSGAAGLTWKFAVGTKVGRSANIKALLQPDTDFSIPIYGLGPLPIALTVRQRVMVKTALGVRNSTLSATGNYTFNGSFTAGVVNNAWTVKGPVDFSTETNMMKTADGISLAAEGLDLADEVKVIAGIGVHGFAAGPYFRVTSALGVFKGSSAGMISCKEATIDVKLSGGVGYVIPKTITAFFNAVLSGLNIEYRIDGEGSLQSGDSLTLFNDTSTLNGCKVGAKS